MLSMGPLTLQPSQTRLYPPHQIPKPQIIRSVTAVNWSNLRTRLTITCGLRNAGSRKPMWRSSSFLSTEAIQAVQSLKLAKSPSKLEQILNSRVGRLLKADLLDTLSELQRQNEFQLAFLVFEFIRNEVWYEPNQSLFSDMMLMYGKNKMIEKVEEIFSELKKEGLEPDTRAYTELIGAYLQVNMTEKAMETYECLKASGCIPDKLTLTILIRNLESVGEEEHAAMVRKDCAKYLDSPRKFLKEVERKFPKRRSLNLV